jgi:ABC-type Fe3+/spermidine/putrescine transport system ATPase subunit
LSTLSEQTMVRFANVQKSYDGETLVVKNLILALPLEARNFAKARIESRVKEILNMVQLSAMATCRPGQQLSSPDDLCEQPENSFVARFIGENNKFKGTVNGVDKDGLARVTLDSGENVKAHAGNVAGHDDFAVKVPNKLGGVKISEGREVSVGWRAEDCRASDYVGFIKH